MTQLTLKERIEQTVKEVTEMSAYWTGTPHEQIITQELNALLAVLPTRDYDSVVSQLESLENRLEQAKEELGRSENEG